MVASFQQGFESCLNEAQLPRKFSCLSVLRSTICSCCFPSLTLVPFGTPKAPVVAVKAIAVTSLINAVEPCWPSPGYYHDGRKGRAMMQFRAFTFLSAHMRALGACRSRQPRLKLPWDDPVSQGSRAEGRSHFSCRIAIQAQILHLLVLHLRCSAG